MRFKEWIITENSVVIQIPFNRLFGTKSKINEVIQDIQAGRLSRSTNNPITVSRLNSPRGFFLMDGYHRVFEAMKRGEKTIIGSVSEYLPRIQRSGGAFNNMLTDMVPIIKFSQFLETNP